MVLCDSSLGLISLHLRRLETKHMTVLLVSPASSVSIQLGPAQALPSAVTVLFEWLGNGLLGGGTLSLLSVAAETGFSSSQLSNPLSIANVIPIYKKRQKEDLGNYRPVSLGLVLGKIMEWFILSALTGHVKDSQGIRPSQHGFMKGRSC